MRVALAGKGGAGKTTLSATLARLAARSGRPVLAIDADSNPNLAVALGVDRERAARPVALPPSLVSRRLDRERGASLTVPLSEVLERYGLAAPDGVRVVVMGAPDHAGAGCLCSAHAVVGALLDDLGAREEWLTVLDLEASPEHLSRGTARHADVLLLVAEPYYRALEAVRRLAQLAAELPIPRVSVLANKVRSEEDLQAIAEFCARSDLELFGSVPFSETAGDADRRGVPVVDAAPDVTAAVAKLLEALQPVPAAPGGPRP